MQSGGKHPRSAIPSNFTKIIVRLPQNETEPHFARKKWGFAFVCMGVCWQGDVIYYLNFCMHGWALN